MADAQATYFDGKSSARRSVDIAFGEKEAVLRENGAPVAVWRYADIRRVAGPGDALRLSNVAANELARLEIADARLALAFATRARNLDQAAQAGVSTTRIVLWSLAAAVSLICVALFGVPLLADRLAPLVPISVEKRIGEAVDKQVRTVFGGETCANAAGVAALQKLVAKLNAQMPTPAPLEAAALSSGVPNAVALPGGRVYVFAGLIERAQSADELAGVLAHEIAHVANRDGMRRLIQTGGTSFLIGLLFGDVTGSSVVLTLANELANASYSREAESRADAGAIAAMHALGRSPAGLGELLMRITGAQGGVADLLKSHPLTEDRLARMKAADRPATGAALLDAQEWAALKDVCKPS